MPTKIKEKCQAKNILHKQAEIIVNILNVGGKDPIHKFVWMGFDGV